jgi:hypothetical protein
VLKVVLYGNSLALSGVGASLEGHPGLDLVRVEAGGSGAETLHSLQADVVVFDLATAQPNVVQLFRRHPPVLPIGVDLLKHQVVVFSGKPSRALTTDDLVRVIEGRMGRKPKRERSRP